MIKALGRIIESVEEDDPDEMVNRQEMLDRFNATKVVIILICQDKGDDAEYITNLL